ncbi:hypothetical protein ACQP1W_01120 [Spirillospora sp. CA-255316]
MTDRVSDDLPVTHGPVPTPVTYHQFHLAEEGEDPPSILPGEPTNGLITPSSASCGAIVHTGIAGGRVAVSVELHDAAPPVGAPSWEHWEEIAEVTVESETGQLTVACLMADSPALPLLSPSGAGSYRVRVHARGRDIAYDATVIGRIIEDYLIQIWPASPAAETIHKQTDDCGARLRRSAARNAARFAGERTDSQQ